MKRLQIGGTVIRIRDTTVFLSCLCTGLTLTSCANLNATALPSSTARRLTDATAAITLPAAWTQTQTGAPTATIPPITPPTPTLTPTPRPTFTPKPILTPTATFSVEGASTDDIVAQAIVAYIRNDEHTLLRLYTKEAAEICTIGFGSIRNCIDIAYDIRGLENLEGWYVRTDAEVEEGSILEVETVITQWADDDHLWQHAFFLEKVDGNWLITYPQAKIEVYEE